MNRQIWFVVALACLLNAYRQAEAGSWLYYLSVVSVWATIGLLCHAGRVSQEPT